MELTPSNIATAVGLTLIALGAGYSLSLAKASAQPLPKTQEEIVDELLTSGDVETSFDTESFQDVTYPVAVYQSSKGYAVVGSDSLNELLSEVMDNGNEGASDLYDSITYFVPDEVLDRADLKEIALYVTQYIDSWFPHLILGTEGSK